MSCSCQDSNPRPSCPQLVTILSVHAILGVHQAIKILLKMKTMPLIMLLLLLSSYYKYYGCCCCCCYFFLVFFPSLFISFVLSFSFCFFFYHYLCFIFLKVNARNYSISSLLPQPFPSNLLLGTSALLGRAVTQWLRHYATNRQVAGSVPDGVIGIFQ